MSYNARLVDLFERTKTKLATLMYMTEEPESANPDQPRYKRARKPLESTDSRGPLTQGYAELHAGICANLPLQKRSGYNSIPQTDWQRFLYQSYNGTWYSGSKHTTPENIATLGNAIEDIVLHQSMEWFELCAKPSSEIWFPEKHDHQRVNFKDLTSTLNLQIEVVEISAKRPDDIKAFETMFEPNAHFF